MTCWRRSGPAAGGDGLPASGIGIALAGASRSRVLGNVVTGNRPTGRSLATGGVAVFGTAGLGGADPAGNLVEASQLRDNQPDLSYDGSGTGNTFLHNSCHSSSTFTMIDVLLRGGDDTFSVSPKTAVLGVDEMTINGGRGNDTLNGGADAEHFIGGQGNDFVDGNGGSDTADLGSGWDTFRWDPGDGSDLIDGGTGTDTLDFRGSNAAEIMKLRAVGELSQFTRNLGNVVMDMNRVERLNLVAGGGEDQVTINDMSGTGFRRADVNLTSVDTNFDPVGGPDGAADTVTVNGTNKADDIEVTARDSRVDVEGLRPETRSPTPRLATRSKSAPLTLPWVGLGL